MKTKNPVRLSEKGRKAIAIAARRRWRLYRKERDPRRRRKLLGRKPAKLKAG